VWCGFLNKLFETTALPKSLDALDEKFFALIESEAGGFENAADGCVERMGQRE
jgi:hypothetical protein